MDKLTKDLSYSFRDKSLLTTALTHSSFANENKAGNHSSNERLEFLGDSILGMLVAQHLYSSYPEMPEGRMTRIRAELVCEQSLSSAAARLGLGEHILLGRGEENSGGRKRPSILADAVEALLAAIFLDGGIDPAREFVTRFILSGNTPGSAADTSDYKTALQERLQRDGGSAPNYELTGESGPDHMKIFTVQVNCGGKILGSGSGRSKKEAEQTAAKAALEVLSSGC